NRRGPRSPFGLEPSRAKPHCPRERAVPAITGRTPLVGRDRELGAVIEHLAAVRGGPLPAPRSPLPKNRDAPPVPRVVSLAGEAGIGKSRLAAEVAARAAEMGYRILKGRCFETDRSLPFAPLLDLLRSLVAGRPTDEIVALFGEAPELV